jgi:hypothetical protein
MVFGRVPVDHSDRHGPLAHCAAHPKEPSVREIARALHLYWAQAEIALSAPADRGEPGRPGRLRGAGGPRRAAVPLCEFVNDPSPTPGALTA